MANTMKSGYNESIGCKVEECKFHAGSKDYCTLNQIVVDKHEPVAKSTECTDCGSFEMK